MHYLKDEKKKKKKLVQPQVSDVHNQHWKTKAVLQLVLYLLSYSRLKVENENASGFPL